MSGSRSPDTGSGRRDNPGSVPSVTGPVSQNASVQDEALNSMAIAGLAIVSVSLVLYATLFYFARELPDTQQELLKLSSNTPLFVRIMLTAGGAFLLNVVAMALSAAAWIQTAGRSRLSIAGLLSTALMLLAFSFVVFLALVAPRGTA